MEHQIAPLISLFLVSVATQTTIPIPLDAIILGMVKLKYDYILVTVIASTGLTIGAIIDYAVGRYGISTIPWLNKKRSSKGYRRAVKFYRRYGQWTLLFSSVPFVGKYFPLVAGVMELSFPSFLIFYALGKVVYYGLIAVAILYAIK